MRIKSKFIYFISLIACIHLGLSISNSSAVDPYPTIEIPIFHKGYDVKEFFNPSKKTKSIIYHIPAAYSATEVLQFYDSYFNGRGWRSSFEICQRNWEDLIDGTKTGKPIVKQLFASWNHLELNLNAVLWLRYEMFNKERQKQVVVKCQLQPKVNQ